MNYDDNEQAPQVHNLKLVKIDSITLLVIMLDNSKVFVYEDNAFFPEKDSEKFRFKLVCSHVLMKPCNLIKDKYCHKIIKNEKMLIILHPYKTFTISIRKGHILFHNIG